ncbi:MAG TPA: hypothetical protein PK402_03385 [Tepidisphaeraceae bacterium]|nr:hypothetical protein [Tepidisphaeraceae bacterium]
MNEETPLLRSIDWKSVLPVTQIFRSFRIAIHPSKIALALVAIVLICAGGRLVDLLYWNDRPVPNEIGAVYEDSLASGGRVNFESLQRNVRQRYVFERDQLKSELRSEALARGERIELIDFETDEMIAEIVRRRDAEVTALKSAAEPTTAPGVVPMEIEDRDAGIRQAYRQAAHDASIARYSAFRGPFVTFIDYELVQIDEIAMGVLRFDWLPGENREPGRSGVFMGLYRFVIVGPSWALAHYFFSFFIIAAWALLVWSIFGGAIARIAAVHVAKEETISIRQALRFSLAKLFSFLSAPLLPLALVGACALTFALAGWLSELRMIGSLWTIVVGMTFIVALLIAAFMACSLFGTIGGFGLMYPTIAVEGSDSFDAISRSFSYVFARPWKMTMYSLVGLMHAAITYLFLRFMLFLTLGLLHFFLIAWTNDRGPDGTTSLVNVFTGPPSFEQLTSAPDRFALTSAESTAWWGLYFWLYLFVALLGAYLLSVYVSTNTIIYYLLRQDVDATELDDVYLEPMDDDFDYTNEPTETTKPESKPEVKTETPSTPTASDSTQTQSAVTPEPPNPPSDSDASPPKTE